MDDPGREKDRRFSAARRPAVLAALLLIAGVLAHPVFPHWPAIWLAGLALSGVLAFAAFRWDLVSTLLIGTGMFLAGVTLAQLESYYFPRNHISAFAANEPHLAWLEVSIIDPPRIVGAIRGETRALPPKQIAAARVERIETRAGWQDCQGEVLMQIGQPHPLLSHGQTLRVLGMLQRPGVSMNPGQFNWAEYYRDRRVIAMMHVPQADNVQIIGTKTASPLESARRFVRNALAHGFTMENSLDHALLRCLLLGDRDTLLNDVQEQFRKTGTGHHLAISGMHVAVLGFFVIGICRLFRLPPQQSVWIGLLFVIAYGAIALPSPPVVRSVLLCAGVAFGVMLRRAVDAIQILFVSMIAMLIYQPLDLYNAGFLLSFGTVLGLILLTRRMIESINQFRSMDSVVLESFTPATPWRAFYRRTRGFCIEILAAGAVAWIVSAPLIAIIFHQLNPWAIPGSILLGPVVVAALIAGVLKIVLTILWPSLSPVWADVAAGPISWMRHIVDWLASLPGADVPLAASWGWVFLGLYLLLLLWYFPIPRLSRFGRHAPIAGCLLLLLVPFSIGSAPSRESERLRVAVLAVGAGSCSVVELPRGDILMIDCGSSTLIDLTRKCIAPYLRYHGNQTIRRLYISHANYDHFSAASQVVPAYGVDEIHVSPQFVSHSTDNPPAESLLDLLHELDRAPKLIWQNHWQHFAGGAEVQVLWPPADAELDPNNSSLVLRLTFAGRSVLFTGDIESEAQSELLKNPDELKSDVLIAPHHGSVEETTAAFIQAVDPEIIISSNDRTLSMRQKHLPAAAPGRTLYRTHTSGAVTVEINGKGELQVEPYIAENRP